ncbi:LssY C-terminal domain-containing protein [Thalassoglobus polymorphus]|uniref:LssY-like C-terminal domain-containing protein n=1 Tax=Thalassoglobus polymorphus TaxID=2527994 RepID=A0A517QQC7_9PLAN|nr:LssY C-terminal domain-containing protein [Thalassoglobus polymorphus]QDT33807.1 hypothetical protein Mal48_30620 [Thalassoglobus polymorphus]
MTSGETKKKRTDLIRVWLARFLVAYFLVAYILLPFVWKQYTRRHPVLDESPRLTTTGDGHAGDPLNIALVGTEAEIKEIMKKAKWYPADPLGFRSDLKIAADTVLKRSYVEAPVSSLYLFGRKEDLAFEQPVGNDPRKRHHVRFWKNPEPDQQGRQFWLGSASYDERVGFSHTTGEITHHIAPDVDKERDHLLHDLQQTQDLSEVSTIPDFHKILEGKNGGGDRWYTDGAMAVAVIKND